MQLWNTMRVAPKAQRELCEGGKKRETCGGQMHIKQREKYENEWKQKGKRGNECERNGEKFWGLPLQQTMKAVAVGGSLNGRWGGINPFQQQQKLNPFLEDELGEMHPIQQQYLITKSYLEQAAKAGRLDEVEMLERNLQELEMDLKRQDLETPRAP